MQQTPDFRPHTELGPAFGTGECTALAIAFMLAAAFALVATTSFMDDSVRRWLAVVPAAGLVTAIGAIAARKRRHVAIPLLGVSAATFAAWLCIGALL